MRVLVTGGMGFIGWNLSVRLLSMGIDVVIIDSMAAPTVRVQTVSPNSTGVLSLLPIDIRDILKLSGMEDIQAVFHFAAHYANELSIAEPVEDVSVNVTGTATVLEFCRQNKVPIIVYASSSGVYGDTCGVPCREDMYPLPVTPYQISKYAGELLCLGYSKLHGISAVCPRLFNVYGCGDIPGYWRSAVPNFFVKALKGEDIIVTGKLASRDFSYIDDTVSGIIAGYNFARISDEPTSVVYNIGTGKEVRITDLVTEIVRLTGSRSKILIQESRLWDESLRRSADVSVYRSLFPASYCAMRELKAGLRDSLYWYLRVCARP